MSSRAGRRLVRTLRRDASRSIVGSPSLLKCTNEAHKPRSILARNALLHATGTLAPPATSNASLVQELMGRFLQLHLAFSRGKHMYAPTVDSGCSWDPTSPLTGSSNDDACTIVEFAGKMCAGSIGGARESGGTGCGRNASGHGRASEIGQAARCRRGVHGTRYQHDPENDSGHWSEWTVHVGR